MEWAQLPGSASAHQAHPIPACYPVTFVIPHEISINGFDCVAWTWNIRLPRCGITGMRRGSSPWDHHHAWNRAMIAESMVEAVVPFQPVVVEIVKNCQGERPVR